MPKPRQDHIASLFFMAIGLSAMVVAQSYGVGTFRQLGAGAMPALLGGVIFTLAFVMLIRTMLKPETSAPLEPFTPRPFVFVIAAIIAFPLFLAWFGLIAAVSAVIAMTALARPGQKRNPVEIAVLAAGTSAFCAVVFVYFLRIPIQLWRWF